MRYVSMMWCVVHEGVCVVLGIQRKCDEEGQGARQEQGKQEDIAEVRRRPLRGDHVGNPRVAGTTQETGTRIGREVRRSVQKARRRCATDRTGWPATDWAGQRSSNKSRGKHACMHAVGCGKWHDEWHDAACQHEGLHMSMGIQRQKCKEEGQAGYTRSNCRGQVQAAARRPHRDSQGRRQVASGGHIQEAGQTPQRKQGTP